MDQPSPQLPSNHEFDHESDGDDDDDEYGDCNGDGNGAIIILVPKKCLDHQ